MTDLQVKWIVFDDDPTGTQTVSGVDVLLKPSREALQRYLTDERRVLYVLTNSRAMPENDAVSYLTELYAVIEDEANRAGCRVGYVLRGDSTLRGHVSAEMDVLGEDGAVGLFVPAFPECGRVTLDGVHYLIQGDIKLNAADTEFARDAVFGYRSRTMIDWVAEKGHVWTARTVTLRDLRVSGGHAVCEALLHAEPRTVVIPDAETEADVRLIADGLARAEAVGRRVVVRSASTFAAARCGLQALALNGVPGGEAKRLLVVCGSHTTASTRQLEKLVAASGCQPVVVPTSRVFAEGTEAVVPELVEALRQGLETSGFAILATERLREAQHQELHDGAQMMLTLTETVRAVSPNCDAVVSKGGITSAQVASDGLQAEEAEVTGQLEAGISLWRLRLPENARMWYAVIPGNVGDDGTLVRIVSQMKSSIIPSSTGGITS